MDNKNMNQKGYTKQSIIDQPEESKAFPLALILAVVTFPLWIGLVAAIGGTVIGIAASIIASGIGFAVAGFSLLITAYSVGGFSGGLLLTGVGFLLFALTILTLILFVVFCGELIPWLVKSIFKIGNKIVEEKE
ncbi:MAG: hypothetical protein K6G64_02615 [Eubacterium sp.]|nr:hypothetical protein [Eubacterium sp.]